MWCFDRIKEIVAVTDSISEPIICTLEYESDVLMIIVGRSVLMRTVIQHHGKGNTYPYDLSKVFEDGAER